MNVTNGFVVRVTVVSWLLLSSILASSGEGDDKKSAGEVSQKLQPVGDQAKLRGKGVGKYLSLLSFTKWKPADFFELQHNLDMCQSIADEDYKVIDAATKDQVTSQERYGMTILHWAFLTGDHVAFEKLLKRGADVHLKCTEDVKGDWVFFMKDTQFVFNAVHRVGYGEKFLDVSLDYLTDPDCRCSRNNGTLLHEYIITCMLHASAGSSIRVKKMLDAGCNPSAIDSNMRTPCALAAGAYMPELSLLMLDHGADPTLKNRENEDLKAVIERVLKDGVPVPPSKKDLTDAYLKLAERVGANVDFALLKAAQAAKP